MLLSFNSVLVRFIFFSFFRFFFSSVSYVCLFCFVPKTFRQHGCE